jgi:signal transduction histidine kinase
MKISLKINRVTLKSTIQTLIIGSFIIGLTYLLYRERQESLEKKISTSHKEVSNLVSQEFTYIFTGIENDLDFLKKSTLRCQKSFIDCSLNSIAHDFIKTHENYFNFRVVDLNGKILFNIIQTNDGSVSIEKNQESITDEDFFNNLVVLKNEEIYVSKIDLYKTNGIVEKPFRPTMRIARKIVWNNTEVVLMLNIEASLIQNKILNVFSKSKTDIIQFVDAEGKKYFSNEDGYDYSWINDSNKKIKVDEIISILKSQKNGSTEFKNQSGKFHVSPILTKHNLKNSKNLSPLYFIYFSSDTKIYNNLRVFKLVLISFDIIAIFIIGLLIYRYEVKNFMNEISNLVIQEQESFIGNVTHQLKTPLSIMKNDLEDLTTDPSVSSAVFNTVASLKEEVVSLSKVVDNLLFLSRINTVPTSLLFEEIRLEELILTIVSRLKKLAAIEGIKINVNFEVNDSQESGLFIVKGEEQLLRCLFENIIENAIKYSNPNSHVDIVLKNMNNSVVVEIKDNGVGVTEANVTNIFKNFFRENKKNVKGSGLGLTLALKIATVHNGKIEYQANDPHGSIFIVKLPIKINVQPDVLGKS